MAASTPIMTRPGRAHFQKAMPKGGPIHIKAIRMGPIQIITGWESAIPRIIQIRIDQNNMDAVCRALQGTIGSHLPQLSILKDNPNPPRPRCTLLMVTTGHHHEAHPHNSTGIILSLRTILTCQKPVRLRLKLYLQARLRRQKNLR